MSTIMEGDEWKYAGKAKPLPSGTITRARAQELLDDCYARGRINLETWRVRTSVLGEPTFRRYDALV